MHRLYIGLLALVPIMAGLHACTRGGNQQQAELDAHQWALGIGLQNPHASCVDVDLNNDGYVSCTVTADGRGPIGIDCAASNPLYWGSCNQQQRGCRLTRHVVNPL